MLSTRTFGVEIECGHPSIVYSALRGKLANKKEFAGFSVGKDGSGIEVRTPILKGLKGYKTLTAVMDYLNELGCYVTRSDGMHVHIGAAFLQDDTPAAKRLAALWLRNQALIGRMCSSHRLAGGGYSPPFPANASNEVGKIRIDYCHAGDACKHPGHRNLKQWPGRYSINFYSLTEHGTIEFRIHEGCLNPVKAVAWVQFCQKFIDYIAEGNEVVTWRSKSAMLRALGIPQDAISTLAQRQEQMPAQPARVFAKTMAQMGRTT